MRDVRYRIGVGPVENAYRDDSRGGFVLLPRASVPDVCVVCGSPAMGRIYNKEFTPYRYPSWHVPFFWDVVYLIFGNRYRLDFPVCAQCQPENFDIHPVLINKDFAVLTGASRKFLASLSSIPPDLAAKVEGTRFQRMARWLGPPHS